MWSCPYHLSTFTFNLLPESQCFCSFLWELCTLLFQSPETFCSSLCFLHYLSVKSLPHTSQTRLGHLDIDFHATLHFLIHTTLVVICSKYTFTIQQVDPRRWGSSLSCPSLYPWPLAEYLTHSECAINIWGWMKNEWMEDWYDSYFWCWIMTIWA